MSKLAAAFLLLAAPAFAQTTPTAPAGTTATAGNPNLAVASIKLENGTRLSTIIGAAVYGQDDKELGKVDDLIMTKDDTVTLAVISVGGFLGLGSKLVAFPFKSLTRTADHWTIPDATADKLTAMPSFQY